MVEISQNTSVVTFINVFTMAPEHQHQVIDLLTEVTDRFVRHAKGFVSSSLHKGTEGTKVIMYTQRRSLEEYQAMREDPRPLPYLQKALTIASFEPGSYEIIEIFEPKEP